MTYTANEKRILTLTCSAHFLTHLYELTFPAIALTVRDDLGWTLGEVLRLSFLMYLLFGLGALPMGVLTDRWRSRWVLGICMFGAGLGCILVALATTRAQFVMALALVGVCISAYHPAGMALLSRAVRGRGRALGINGVFGNLGSAAAPFIAGLLAYELGWRAAYTCLGALGLAVGLATLLLHVDEESVAAAPARVPVGGHSSSLVYFAILCVAMMLAGFAYRGVALMLPATFREGTTFLSDLLARFSLTHVEGIQNLSATLIASAVYAVGMLGQIAGGHLADRHDLRKLYLIFHAASLPFITGMAFLGEQALVVAAGTYIFFSLGMQPIENSLVARFTPERWRSTSYGVKFVLNFGVGSLAVYAVTALHAGGGLGAVYGALAFVVLGVCIATALLLYRSRGVSVVNEPAAEMIS
jgi:MFS family permease